VAVVYRTLQLELATPPPQPHNECAGREGREKYQDYLYLNADYKDYQDDGDRRPNYNHKLHELI